MRKRIFPPAVLLSSLLSGQVTYDRILNAEREPGNWMTYSGGYKGWRPPKRGPPRRSRPPIWPRQAASPLGLGQSRI